MKNEKWRMKNATCWRKHFAFPILHSSSSVLFSSLCLRVSVVICLAATSTQAQSPTPPEALHDAELTSVTFVDADTGWAVGDRGVIWHTIDGGRHWQRQDSPTRSRLESVCFVDAESGWAVGGSHRPYTHQAVGVVLRTVDGGRTWQNTPGLHLPALKHVKFFGPRQGVAIGESSALFPGGVLMTADGGRSWSSLSLAGTWEQGGRGAGEQGSRGIGERGMLVPRWTAGDFLTPQGGLVLSSDGSIGVVNGLELRSFDGPPIGPRRGHAMSISREGTAWLCGDGGLLMRSTDVGASWSPLDSLPRDVADRCDFAALATLGPHVWVAGDPGTFVLHSPDGGKSWQTFRTDNYAPLNSLFFLDEQRGWAAGALGTILVTRDGGQTWRVQRQAGTRAALLAVFSQPNRVPHELIVQQAGNEGYLTVAEILTQNVFTTTLDDVRTREAATTLLASHCSTAWQFPLSQHTAGASLEQVVAAWDKQHTGQALAVLEEHLVRRIRTWRPEVIVTEDAHPRGDDPLAHLTNQLVLAAVHKAADPAAYREQITHAGLTEWKVKKVFATASADKQGDVKLVCSQLATRIGASLADVADEARGQLDDTYQLAPANRGFTLLIDQLPQGQGKRDIFSGIALSPGGEARRPLSNPPVPDFASLTKQIQKRQMLQGLLERSDKDPLRGTAWQAQVSEMTKGLSPATSSRIMYYLAQRYQNSGESELAADVMNSLVEKHPDHPLTDAALLWLLHYYASAEAAHQSSRLAPRDESLSGKAASTPTGFPLAEREGYIASIEPSNRLERAAAYGKLLEKMRPALFAEPAVRFTLANLGQASSPAVTGSAGGTPAPRLLQSLAAARSSWSQCAKAELWLSDPSRGECPKNIVLCKTASTKPKLDGRLDDGLWQAASPVSLRQCDSREPLESIVALGYDDEYLYLAVSCRRMDGVEYKPDDRVRQRDSDLAPHDRVEILLDIDRDYATSYRLVVDHRGWTNESCLGDPSWNPTWYVAAAGDDAYWTAEAAIPLAELTGDPALKKSHWAAGFERVIPASHSQGWTTPAELASHPELLGLVQFE